MQNTPPGAWESSLHNRVPDCSRAEMEHLLYKEKSLIQAWSLRGAPVVFPASQSSQFLSALISQKDEPWIYTAGITLALDFLQMAFDDLFELLVQVMPQLDNTVIVSKSALVQTLAGWMHKRWLGHALQPGEDAVKQLVRSYLHCYGLSTAEAFAGWGVPENRAGACGTLSQRKWKRSQFLTKKPLSCALTGSVSLTPLLRKRTCCFSEPMIHTLTSATD